MKSEMQILNFYLVGQICQALLETDITCFGKLFLFIGYSIFMDSKSLLNQISVPSQETQIDLHRRMVVKKEQCYWLSVSTVCLFRYQFMFFKYPNLKNSWFLSILLLSKCIASILDQDVTVSWYERIFCV